MAKRDKIEVYQMPPTNVRVRQDNREEPEPVGSAVTLQGFSADDFPRKAEDARITGSWAVDSLVGELKGAVMSADVLNAVGGSLVIAKAAGVLAADMTTGDSANTWNMILIDPPGGGFLFANSDICRIKAADVDDDVVDTWFTVSSRTDLGDGTQLYLCTYQNGDTDDTIRAGNLVVDYGASGQGLLTLTADATNAPYYAIETHAGAPWTTLTTRARLGNMNGVFGIASDYYGLGVGDYSGGNYLLYETNGGFKFKAGGGQVTIDGDGIDLGIPAAFAQPNSLQWSTTAMLTSFLTVGGIAYSYWVMGNALSGKPRIYLTQHVVGDTYNITFVGNSGAANTKFEFQEADLYANQDVRIGGGLYVGSTGTNPDTDDVYMDGSIMKSTALGARVYNNAAITIGDSSWTALTFNSERFDNDTIHSTVSNTSRLTATTAGVYQITGHLEFEGNDTGRRAARITLGGATVLALERDLAPAAAINCELNITTLYELAATNYVELEVYQNSGGDLDVEVSANYSPEFMMVRVA